MSTFSAVAFAGLMLTFAIFGCGDDPVQPDPPPRITQFSANPTDIMPGDSTLISYAVTGATTVRLFPDGTTLSPASSGQTYVKPTVPTEYGLVATNAEGRDSASLTISMNGAVPWIRTFRFNRDTVLTGELTGLFWATVRADSLVIDNGIGRVTIPDSNAIGFNPTVDITYTGVAYNDIGSDTATASVRVESPATVEAPAGRYYRGLMGNGIVTPEMSFRALDNASAALTLPWVHFRVAEGDGSLAADSAQPGPSRSVTNDYTFDGSLGYGVIEAFLTDIDTIQVEPRASVIRFGGDGQGQYVRLSDTYEAILALNGTPISVDQDPRPDILLNYANYETSLGLVFALLDSNDDNIAQPTEELIEIIMAGSFDQISSPEGVRIGSGIQDVRDAYGVPDNFFYDPAIPPAWGMQYDSLGALFYASTVAPDSAIIEIHMWDPADVGSSGSGLPTAVRQRLPN